MGIRGKTLSGTLALPNGAAITASAPLDLGMLAAFIPPLTATINAPVLSTGQLPDAATITYWVEGSNDAAFGNPVNIAPVALVQTGAGGAGAAVAQAVVAMPKKLYRWVRLMAKNSGLGNASEVSATLILDF